MHAHTGIHSTLPEPNRKAKDNRNEITAQGTGAAKRLACYRPNSFPCNKSTLIEKLKAACKRPTAIQIIIAATIEEGICKSVM